MWLYFPAKNLSHSEGTWLCDYYFSQKNIPFWKKHVYVIMISSQKSIPIWGDLIRWLYPKEWNLSHSEGTWLCDYTFQPKIYPILRDLTMWLYIPAKNLSHSEGTWLYDCILRNEFYRILRRPDHVIILSSLKSIPFWEDLTMWLYFPAKNLSNSEGTWLCHCVLRIEIVNILRWPDYVIILSSLKSIPFWGDLTMRFYFPAKNLSHSEGTWLCDHNF